MSKSEIVDRIKTSMDSNGITAYEISKNTQLSEVGINRIRKGEIKNPNDSTIEKLSEFLESRYGISKTWLLTGKGLQYFPVLPVDEHFSRMASAEKERKFNQIATFVIKHESEMMQNALFKSFVEKLAYRIVIDTMNEKNGKKGE